MKTLKYAFFLCIVLCIVLFSTNTSPSHAQEQTLRIHLTPAVTSGNWTQVQLTETANVIQRRLVGLGYVDAVIQVVDDSILVEVYGVIDDDLLLDTLVTQAHLEFVDFSSVTLPIQDLIGETVITSSQLELGIVSADALPATGQPFQTVITGDDLQGAEAQFNQQMGDWWVAVDVSGDAAAVLGSFTETHIGQPMAIVLDGEVLSVPIIQSRIDTGLIISGNFTEEAAKTLASQLRSGRLPLPMQIYTIETVTGDSGGDDDLPQTDDGRPIVARVNGVPILLEDFQAEMRAYGDVRSEDSILEWLIQVALYEQEAAVRGVVVDDAYVDRIIRRNIGQFYPETPPNLANGAAVYANNCVSCHGDTGAGDGRLVLSGDVPQPLNYIEDDITALYTVDAWKHVIVTGRVEKLMPPWQSALSEAQIWDVTVYTYLMHRGGQPANFADTDSWRNWLFENADRERYYDNLLMWELLQTFMPNEGDIVPTLDLWFAYAESAEQSEDAQAILLSGVAIPNVVTDLESAGLQVARMEGLTEGQLVNGALDEVIFALDAGQSAGPTPFETGFVFWYLDSRGEIAASSEDADNVGRGRFGRWERAARASADVEIYLTTDTAAELSPEPGNEPVFSQGWNVYVTNVVETPSDDRGWKNVTLDVVFESANITPYPLYGWKYISVFDSTGTWRERIPLGWERGSMWRDNRIMLPPGVRFVRTSNEFRVPEKATMDIFRIEVCGSDDCDPQYAVFTADVTNVSDSDFVFPSNGLVANIPTITNGKTVDIPGVARVTFKGEPRVEQDGPSILILFDVDVENLTGNDITGRDIYLWQGTSVTNTGHLYADDNVFCTTPEGDSNWVVPPAYTDPLVCRAVVEYNQDILPDVVWFGLSWEETGQYFSQSLTSPN